MESVKTRATTRARSRTPGRANRGLNGRLPSVLASFRWGWKERIPRPRGNPMRETSDCERSLRGPHGGTRTVNRHSQRSLPLHLTSVGVTACRWVDRALQPLARSHSGRALARAMYRSRGVDPVSSRPPHHRGRRRREGAREVLRLPSTFRTRRALSRRRRRRLRLFLLSQRRPPLRARSTQPSVCPRTVHRAVLAQPSREWEPVAPQKTPSRATKDRRTGWHGMRRGSSDRRTISQRPPCGWGSSCSVALPFVCSPSPVFSLHAAGVARLAAVFPSPKTSTSPA